LIRFRTLRGRKSLQRTKPLSPHCRQKFSALQLLAERFRFRVPACSFEPVYERLQSRQLRDRIREQVFSAPTSINELYAGFRVAVNSPHLTDRPERRRVDVHDDLSARAAFNRHGGVGASSAQAQVEDLPRKEKGRWMGGD
jgi:hypothetical protein